MDNHEHTNYVEVIHHVVVHEQQPKKTSNSFGNAGFTLSLLSILLFWLPFADIVFLLLGFIFSIIGLFRAPRGLAIAGLVLAIVCTCWWLFLLYVMNNK